MSWCTPPRTHYSLKSNADNMLVDVQTHDQSLLSRMKALLDGITGLAEEDGYKR